MRRYRPKQLKISLIRFVPDKTTIRFMKGRFFGIGLSVVLSTASIILFFAPGLNYGIDFVGGIQMEVQTDGPADFGKLRGDADIMAMFEAGFGEVYAVGKAKGIALPDNTVENMVKATKAFPDTMMASMAHDLIRGGRIELPWLSGKVVAMGRELGVPTPVHNVLHAMLKPHTMGNAA